MSKSLFGVLSVLSFYAFAGTAELLNFDWQFRLEGAEAWRTLDLPHDFAIEGPFLKAGSNAPNGFRPFRMGVYRKTFRTTPAMAGKCVMLHFEGAYQKATVKLNGKQLGEPNLLGYLDFTRRIENELKPVGEENELEVEVDNRTRHTSRWYTGAGLYRDVWLKTFDKIHVAYDGLQVTTPEITDAYGNVKIVADIRNEIKPNFEGIEKKRQNEAYPVVKVAFDVLERSGAVVATSVRTVQLGSDIPNMIATRVNVPNPKRWSPTTPELYTVRVSLLQGDGKDAVVLDTAETRFGFRTIRLTDHGFYLNDKPFKVIGFCPHTDMSAVGVAAYPSEIRRRIKFAKAMGFNAVRLSHNPYSRAFLNICDEEGVLVEDEMYDKWDDQFYGARDRDRLFPEAWKRDLRAFVQRDRNHPCVFIWSVGNEIVRSQHAVGKAGGTWQLHRMMELVKGMDPTREVTAAMFPSRDYGFRQPENRAVMREKDVPSMALVEDVMSANYMEDMYRTDREKYPGLRYIASEVVTAVNGRAAWGQYDHEHANGIFYWGAFNYWGETRGWPIKDWERGFVNRTLSKRPSYYSVKSFFLPDVPCAYPQVFGDGDQRAMIIRWNSAMTALNQEYSHWNYRAGARCAIEGFTNCRVTELFVNGKSQGRKDLGADFKPGLTPNPLWENVPWEAGEVRLVGYKDGKAVCESVIRTAGEVVKFRLAAEQQRAKADGMGLLNVVIEAVDARGIVNPHAKIAFEVAVEGPAKLIGIDNDDCNTDLPPDAAKSRTHHGYAMAFVRVGREPGVARVTVTPDGFDPVTLDIPVER